MYKNKKSSTSKINHIRKELPPEEHFKHENAVPAIIPKEIWKQTQFLLEQKLKNVRASFRWL
ncbi:recombinase family protein [Yeguia hominis]|uniref:recombinase family protein n=1 Tax=Yeguia hominis TaxID=2763662 RepID=UPI003D265635